MESLYKFKGYTRQLIRERGITIARFAAMMEISSAVVYQWLNGNAGTYWWRVEKAAAILGVAPEYISWLFGKTQRGGRTSASGAHNPKKHHVSDKPCGYARALEICGGMEYLTSSN